MSASLPSISVIVVCKNPGARLRTALESVWTQSGAVAELIVIDGGSTDGSREWLETQRARLATLVSEPDGGIYDAMNKGVAAARGKWIFFLGADDRLANQDVLPTVARTLAQSDAGVLVGEARFDDGRIYAYAGASAAVRRNLIHHQAAFYRRDLFTRRGGFDTRLRIQADYDHNLRLLRAGEAIAPMPLRISECAAGGMSDSGRWANYSEEITVRHRHFPAWHCWLWDVLSVVRYLRKKIVRQLPKRHD